MRDHKKNKDLGTQDTVRPLIFVSEEERYRSFGAAMDRIHREARSKVGEEDLNYIRNVDRFSRGCEVAGRTLLLAGPGPVSFAVGCGFLWLYKQLQATEIGHTVLHGAFNRIDAEGAEQYHNATYLWQTPIDDKAWIAGHNGKHHGLTNVYGADPDVTFGQTRLTEDTPHRWPHYFQVPATLVAFPLFSPAMALHLSGVLDFYIRSEDEPKAMVGDDMSDERRKEAWKTFARKAGPYYAMEFVVYPALAGFRFFRMLAGNVITEAMRDVYTAATIHCGHVGGDCAHYPEGTRPHGKGERYAMQVASANNFEVPWAVSVLCGALDLQIEHHLFPSLPTNRLREVAPKVREACEAHGVEYKTDTWPRTLGRAFKHLWRLSFPTERDKARQRDLETDPEERVVETEVAGPAAA